MDKYDKRGMEWCPDELEHRFHTDKHRCVAIAQALRESAAEAFDDCATVYIADGTAAQGLARARAAALRAGAGEDAG